jgi:hypothetical protein
VINFAVGIGFLGESEQNRPCYPKEDCDLAVKINHSTDSFNITIVLLDSNGKSGKLHHEFYFVSIYFSMYSK